MTVPPVDVPRADDRRHPRTLRALDGLASLLTAGLVVVGVIWLIGRLLAPTFVPAAGAAGGAGPWWGIGLHLGIGLAGEMLLRRGRRWSSGGRTVTDLIVIAAAAGVLWFVWAG